VVLLLTGCSHGDLFQPQSEPARSPRGSGAFHRVTYNVGDDLFPSWVPGAPDVAYSFAPGDQIGNDRCAGTIPAEGGVRRTLACRSGPPSDSIATSNWPVLRQDGRLAYVWESLNPYPSTQRPDSALLYIQNGADASGQRVAHRFPHVIPGVDVYTSATHVGWLNADTLLAVAVADVLIRDCSGCAFRTVRAGRAVVLVDVSSLPGALIVMSGTGGASAVAPGLTGRDFYFTIAGDSRVYHRDIPTDSTSITHDFGAAGIARDPQVAGRWLVAVVGGTVAYRVDPNAGPVQEDSGGTLHLVDRIALRDSVLPDSGVRYRHPALAPTGDRLLAEGWAAGTADLWFFRLP